MDEEYRCTETIDLEDMIKMKAEQFCTKVKAVVTYKSGRTEEFQSDLLKGGDFRKSFVERVNACKKFPTVENVEVVKF